MNENENRERTPVERVPPVPPAWPPAWLSQAKTTPEIPPAPAILQLCPHTEIREFRTFDGYLNRQCKACGEWFTCRRETP
jgi:hypothetical protein